MSTPSRFINGITNVVNTTTMGQYLAPDPTLLHTYFNDFDTYAAGDWTVTETSGGATEALTDGDNGLLLLTNTASENDVLSMQLVKESFVCESGKKMWFKILWQYNEATQFDLAAGLIVRDTSPIATAPSDAIYFRKDDGDTNWDLCIMNSSGVISSTAAIGTAEDDTDISLGWYFDGINTFHYFVNDVEQGTVETTDFPTTELAVTFATAAGASAAKTATLDYVLASKER